MTDATQRIDKWLWFARFFKTRGLAAEAVKAGHVEVNETRAKPGKGVRAGDVVKVRKSPYEFEVTVLDAGQRRGSATEARTLYRETEASEDQRARVAERLNLARHQPAHHGKPTKRDRREFERARRRALTGDD